MKLDPIKQSEKYSKYRNDETLNLNKSSCGKPNPNKLQISTNLSPIRKISTEDIRKMLCNLVGNS